MPKWKQENLDHISNEYKCTKFVDKLFNTLYLTYYPKSDTYYIEYYNVDSRLRQRCQNFPGYEFIKSYNPDMGGDGMRLKRCSDKEVIATFLQLIDESNPLENVKRDVYAFFGLQPPVAEEKFVDPGIADRVSELTEELRQQKNVSASLMVFIKELQSEVAELKSQLAASTPKKDDVEKRTPGMWK